MKLLIYMMALSCAVSCFGTPLQEEPQLLPLSSHRPSDTTFVVSEGGGKLLFSENGETVAEVDHTIGDTIVALRYLDFYPGLSLALSSNGKLTIVKQSGEVALKAQIDMPSHFDDGPDGQVCAISDSQSICFWPNGDLVKAPKHTSAEASSCRATVSSTSLNFSPNGETRTLRIQFSNCSRGSIIGTANFLSVSTTTLGSNTNLTLRAPASRNINGGSIVVLGSDNKVAALIPVTQYPIGTTRGSVTPNSFIRSSSSGGATAYWSSIGGWSNVSGPSWISVSGRRDSANTTVSFYVFANAGAARAGTLRFISKNGAVTFVHFAQDAR